MDIEVQGNEWQKGECSVIFILYRWCFAIWFAVTMGSSMELFFFNGKWFIYFTNWGFILCTLTGIYGAILISMYWFTSPKAPCPYWMLRLYWVLHISSFVCATGLSFTYWIFIFPFSNFQPPEGKQSTEFIRLYRYFFTDQMVVAFPTRIMHCIYPAIIAVIYLLFTIVYYIMGGENVIGNPYIYKFLNWGDNPLLAAIVGFGGVVLSIPMCLLGYLIYKIRISLGSS